MGVSVSDNYGVAQKYQPEGNLNGEGSPVCFLACEEWRSLSRLGRALKHQQVQKPGKVRRCQKHALDKQLKRVQLDRNVIAHVQHPDLKHCRRRNHRPQDCGPWEYQQEPANRLNATSEYFIRLR